MYTFSFFLVQITYSLRTTVLYICAIIMCNHLWIKWDTHCGLAILVIDKGHKIADLHQIHNSVRVHYFFFSWAILKYSFQLRNQWAKLWHQKPLLSKLVWKRCQISFSIIGTNVATNFWFEFGLMTHSTVHYNLNELKCKWNSGHINNHLFIES